MVSLLLLLYFESTNQGAVIWVRVTTIFLFPVARQLQPSLSFGTLTLSTTPFCLSFVLPLNPLSQQSLLGGSSRYDCLTFQNDHVL